MIVKISGVILFCIFIALVLPVTAAPSSGIGEDLIFGDYPSEDFQSSLLWNPLFPSIQQATGNSNVYISDLNVQEEYVKITNKGWDSVVMTGWRITNRDGSKAIDFIEWTNPDGSKFNYELRGYSTVTIYSPKEGSPSRTSLYWPKEMWYDGGDIAYLYDNTGKLVSTYSSTAGPTTVPTTVPTTSPTQVPPSGTGSLTVTSVPTGSMVFLDGVYKGFTPITIAGIPAGSHQIRVHRIGYEDYTAGVTITAGSAANVPVTLKTSSGSTTVPTTVPTTMPTIVPTTSPTEGPTGTGTGGLTVTSTPTRAMVFLDGVYRGVTPLTITGISSGIHQLRVTYPGYGEYSSGVNVPAGKTITFQVLLKVASGPTTVPTTVPTTSPTQGPPAGTGSLTVTSIPTRAMVFLDGAYKGFTPITVTGIPVGTHQLKVHRIGYEDYTAGVTITSGSTATVPVTLQTSSGSTTVPTIVPTTSPTQAPPGTGTGTVSVNSKPTGARVYLDYFYAGNTPVTLQNVAPGSHTIRIRKLFYDTYTTTVTVTPGSTVSVSTELTPNYQEANPF